MKKLAEITTKKGIAEIYLRETSIVGILPDGTEEDLEETAETEDEAIEQLTQMYAAAEWNLEIV